MTGQVSIIPDEVNNAIVIKANAADYAKIKAEQAVLDCAAAGVKDIWLHRHVAGGVSDTQAVFRAQEKGLNLITGFCLFMFLPQAAFIHKFHGEVMKLIGMHPKRSPGCAVR